MKPCETLFLVPSLRGGGAERTMVTLLNHMDPRRIHAVLGVLDMQDAEFRSELRPDIEVVELGCRRVRHAVPRIVALVRRLRPRVVMSTLSHLNLTLSVASTWFPAGVRVIGRESNVLSRAFAGSRSRALWYWAIRRLYPRLDRVVCQSHGMRDDLVNGFGFPREQSVVIGNPVDAERIRALACASPGPEHAPDPAVNATVRLVAVGRLSQEKGFDLLIEAVRSCGDARICVNLIGKGPLDQELRRLAADGGVAERVRFLGFQRNPYPYMARADALVLSSRFEGFPNVVLEALACGTPVIACPAAGGTREILDAIPQCEIADQVTAPALASAILRFIERNPGRVPASAIAPYAAARIAREYEEAILDVAGS